MNILGFDHNVIRWHFRSWLPKGGLRKWIWRRQVRLHAWRRFWESYRTYGTMCTNDKHKPTMGQLYPCIGDDMGTTPIEPTYFYQNAWAFEHIVKNRPTAHVDVASHHSFVSLLSKVVPVTMVDIRPLSLSMESIKFIKGSILNLPFNNNSIESLSCLCVIEHIGLGRYGDPIDPLGFQTAFQEIYRVLKRGGRFYVSVPVSNQYIVRFNAGVIFEYKHLMENISKLYNVIELKFIAKSKLTDEFMPDDEFGTTVLLCLSKK